MYSMLSMAAATGDLHSWESQRSMAVVSACCWRCSWLAMSNSACSHANVLTRMTAKTEVSMSVRSFANVGSSGGLEIPGMWHAANALWACRDMCCPGKGPTLSTMLPPPASPMHTADCSKTRKYTGCPIMPAICMAGISAVECWRSTRLWDRVRESVLCTACAPNSIRRLSFAPSINQNFSLRARWQGACRVLA